MADYNLGNVVGLLKQEVAPAKTYVLWGKIINPSFPDIVDIHYYDQLTLQWTPITSTTINYLLKAVIDNAVVGPPGTPTEGDRYLIPDTGTTGDWIGKENQIAEYRIGVWVYQQPLDGYLVMVRTEANKLYEFQGTYNSGGLWFVHDFQVPVAPGTYVPYTVAGIPLGYADLDASGEIPNAYINEDALTFNPATPGNWGAGTDTVKKALDYLILQSGGGGTATIFVADIAGRDALSPPTGQECYVMDASADPTVDSGPATYAWNSSTWLKTSEGESMDISYGLDKQLTFNQGGVMVGNDNLIYDYSNDYLQLGNTSGSTSLIIGANSYNDYDLIINTTSASKIRLQETSNIDYYNIGVKEASIGYDVTTKDLTLETIDATGEVHLKANATVALTATAGGKVKIAAPTPGTSTTILTRNNVSGEIESIDAGDIDPTLALTELTDVDTTGVVTGSMLYNNGTDWIDTGNNLKWSGSGFSITGTLLVSSSSTFNNSMVLQGNNSFAHSGTITTTGHAFSHTGGFAPSTAVTLSSFRTIGIINTSLGSITSFNSSQSITDVVDHIGFYHNPINSINITGNHYALYAETGDVNIVAGNLTANSIIKSGGLSTEFLKADGTVDSTTYAAASTTLAGYGISDTKVNFDTALSDGDFMYIGDAPTVHTHDYLPLAGGTLTGALTFQNQSTGGNPILSSNHIEKVLNVTGRFQITGAAYSSDGYSTLYLKNETPNEGIDNLGPGIIFSGASPNSEATFDGAAIYSFQATADQDSVGLAIDVRADSNALFRQRAITILPSNLSKDTKFGINQIAPTYNLDVDGNARFVDMIYPEDGLENNFMAFKRAPSLSALWIAGGLVLLCAVSTTDVDDVNFVDGTYYIRRSTSLENAISIKLNINTDDFGQVVGNMQSTSVDSGYTSYRLVRVTYNNEFYIALEFTGSIPRDGSYFYGIINSSGGAAALHTIAVDDVLVTSVTAYTETNSVSRDFMSESIFEKVIVNTGTNADFLKGDGTLDSNTYQTPQTTLAGYGITDAVLVDGDFVTAGLMKTDGAGVYSIDSSIYLTSVAWTDLTGARTSFTLSGFNDDLTYDNYLSWNLKTNNTQRTTVTSGGDLDIVAGTDILIGYAAGGVVTITYNGSSGASSFTGLGDTPTNYTGASNQFVVVNSTPDALIFITPDTGDIVEGSNLYYTEARVSANTSVAANTLKVSWNPSTLLIDYGYTVPTAAQIIDWTIDQGATDIHLGNYTNTTYINTDWDHNQLTNYVANEHIRWDLTGLDIIHTDRYTNTTYISSDFTHDSLSGVSADEHIDWALTNVKNIHTDNYTDTIYSHPTYSSTSINTTGASILDTFTSDISGHVTSISTRVLLLTDLGYTGATDANNYVHPTGDGNLHVPANSTTNGGKVLTASVTSGVYTWETPGADQNDFVTALGFTGGILTLTIPNQTNPDVSLDGRYALIEVTQYTDELAQDAIGAMVSAEFTYTDLTPLLEINSIAYSKITGGPPVGAEINVQSDWNALSGDDFILNKPTIPSGNQIIDWTTDQGATNIHAGNYTNTTYATNQVLDWTVDQGATNIHIGNYTNTVYSHPTQSAINLGLSTNQVLDTLVVNTLGHATSYTTRTLTLANLGYTGTTDANTYIHPALNHIPIAGSVGQHLVWSSSGTAAWTTVTDDNDNYYLTGLSWNATNGTLTATRQGLADVTAVVTNLETYFDTKYNNYIHPTGSGNHHLPEFGQAGEHLMWSTDNSGVWMTLVTYTTNQTLDWTVSQGVTNIHADNYTDTNTWRTITAGGNTLGSTETLAFIAGTNITITELAGAVTINSVASGVTGSGTSLRLASWDTSTSINSPYNYTIESTGIRINGATDAAMYLDRNTTSDDSGMTLSTNQTADWWIGTLGAFGATSNFVVWNNGTPSASAFSVDSATNLITFNSNVGGGSTSQYLNAAGGWTTPAGGGNADTITATANSTGTAFPIPFLSAATGEVSIYSDDTFSYNPNLNSLYATNLVATNATITHAQATRNTDTFFYSSTNNTIYKNTAAGMQASLGYYLASNPSNYTSNTGTVTGVGVDNRLAIWNGTGGIDSVSGYAWNGVQMEMSVIKIGNEITIPDLFSTTDPSIGTNDNTAYGINISKASGIGLLFNAVHRLVAHGSGITVTGSMSSSLSSTSSYHYTNANLGGSWDTNNNTGLTVNATGTGTAYNILRVNTDNGFKLQTLGGIGGTQRWYTNNANFITFAGTTITATLSGNASTATWADTVDVNPSDYGTGDYSLVWHSTSDVLYSSSWFTINRDARKLTVSNLLDKGTGIGYTVSVTYNNTTNTAAEWSALPQGYGRMMDGAVIGTAGGAAVANWGYFTKTAFRNVSGGWGGIWVGYSADQHYFGRAAANTNLPTWEKVAIHGTTITATLSGNASTATWADTVDVNSGNNANASYPAVWHSGDTLYSTAGITFHPLNNTITASNFIDASDRRLKTGITRITDTDLRNFNKIDVVSYSLIEGTRRKQWGVVADDMESLYPSLVIMGDDRFRSFDYRSLSMIHLRKTQQHETRLEKLEKEVKRLRKLIKE